MIRTTKLPSATALAAAVIVTVAAAASGCTTVREPFPGRDPGQVWTALIAVAQDPDYDDPDPTKRWRVKENHVYVDDETARLEIYRELDRVLHRPGAKPLRESRTWRFQVMLDSGDAEAGYPPEATFMSRGWGVPSHAQDEADRYFREVREVLSGARALVPEEAGP
jgi:hypothetical protein